MDRLLAQDAIQHLVINFNQAEDQLDFSLLQSCFLPGDKFTLDLSEHLPGTPIAQLTAEEFWQQVKGTVPGFTATHHELGPLQFEFYEGTLMRAQARTTITATYALQSEDGAVSSVVVKGLQLIDAEVAEGRWVIRRFKIVRGVPIENLHLFGIAAERVQKGLQRAMKQ